MQDSPLEDWSVAMSNVSGFTVVADCGVDCNNSNHCCRFYVIQVMSGFRSTTVQIELDMTCDL